MKTIKLRVWLGLIPALLMLSACTTQISIIGEGTVTSSGTSVDCSTGNTGLCTALYTEPIQDTFTATPADGWRFVHWLSLKGDPCHKSTKPVCTHDLNQGLIEPTQTLHMTAVFVNEYQQYADQWNDTFEGDPNMPLGWTGGDLWPSTPLPFCGQCPDEQRYRRLWLFGDSIISSIDEEGYRVAFQGSFEPLTLANYRFGTQIGISYHGSNNSRLAETTLFDWGEVGQEGFGNTSQSWMPLLIDPMSLESLNALRTATTGYVDGDGYTNDGTIAHVHEHPWLDGYRNDNLKPIYEYYNSRLASNDYWDQKMDLSNHGTSYRRIAFYVHIVQEQGTVLLYRYKSNLLDSILLSITPDLQLGDNIFQFEQPIELGYVYPANAIGDVHKQRCSDISKTGAKVTGLVCPLVQYFKYDAMTNNGHHRYTTWENDNGKSLLNWPMSTITVGNDLLVMIEPWVSFSEHGSLSWQPLDIQLAAIIRNVDRPYDQWGRAPDRSWAEKPEQYFIKNIEDIIWGVQFLKDPNYQINKTVYIYGTKEISHESANPNSLHWNSNELYLARVRVRTIDDLIDVKHWQYFADGNWVGNPALATAIGANTGHAFTVHYNADRKLFSLVFGCPFLSPTIYFQMSESVTGPYEATASFDLTGYANEETNTRAIYAVMVHEGLSFDDNSLLISYVRWGGIDPVSGLLPKSDTYVPRFINLAWNEIEPD